MRLRAPERRVLGCLIEKERATPQGYPLTLNALRSACNQSTNRDPVVDYDEQIVEAALTDLREHGLCRIVYSTSNRAAKYRHIADEHFHLGDDEMAVLAVLLLRGPQTVGEIKTRTERLHPFADLQSVQSTLERMSGREDPLVVRFGRRPGQKDARWGELLGGPVDQHGGETAEPGTAEPGTAEPGTTEPGTTEPEPARSVDDRPYGVAVRTMPEPRSEPTSGRTGGPHAGGRNDDGASVAVGALAAELNELREEVATLRAAFEAFRSQFG